MEDIKGFNPTWKILFSNVDLDNYPPIPRKKLTIPGIYCWKIFKGEELVGLYIGETMNIGRRFHHYKKPGVRQKTNIRINKILRESQLKGYRNHFYILDFKGIKFNKDLMVASLSGKVNRLIVESLVILFYQKRYKNQLLNLHE